MAAQILAIDFANWPYWQNLWLKFEPTGPIGKIYGQNLSRHKFDPVLQGVPQLSIHLVLVVFSASRARTEVYFTIFQQPRRRRFQNSPYFPPYVKN